MQHFTIKSPHAQAIIIPERGGLVTEFNVKGKNILFLDKATVENQSVKVRGGIPLLFPNAGTLKDNIFIDKNTILQRHGFAREYAWEVIDKTTGSITMELPITDNIKQQFPYQFSLQHKISLSDSSLVMELIISNNGEEAIPIAPGWHPYFYVPQEKNLH